MLSFKKRAAADVPTPAATKVTVFFDDTGAVKKKDETGAVADLASGAQSGSSVWTLAVDESGASFAGWTVDVGTWASDGTVINQTATTASWKSAIYTATQPLAACYVQADLRINSGSGNPQLAGLVLGNSNSSPEVRIYSTTGTDFKGEIDAWKTAARLGPITLPGGPYATWVTVKILHIGGTLSVWFGTTLIGTSGSAGAADASAFRLVSYGSSVSFRNIKLWTMGLPA